MAKNTHKVGENPTTDRPGDWGDDPGTTGETVAPGFTPPVVAGENWEAGEFQPALTRTDAVKAAKEILSRPFGGLPDVAELIRMAEFLMGPALPDETIGLKSILDQVLASDQPDDDKYDQPTRLIAGTQYRLWYCTECFDTSWLPAPVHTRECSLCDKVGGFLTVYLRDA